jgi:hypothetical protein
MTIGIPTNVQVAGGFWAGVGGYQFQYARSSLERRIARALGRTGNASHRRVMRALNGVAPGAAVADTYTRVRAPDAFVPHALVGRRDIETITTFNNGVTTAAQRDYINAQLYDAYVVAQPYPRDLSGNGGGGKVQK